MQPSKVGQFIIADTILNYVEKFGCDTIIALGGYRRQTEDLDVIYTISSDPKIFKEISGVNVKVARGGSVMGAFGVILGLGKERGMNCLGLLGATSGMYPDLRASKNVLQLLSKTYNLKINLGEIESQVKNMENKFKTLSEISQLKTKKESKREEKKRYIS
jgi:proteasome assembly chaperone (PAC2) family protein